MLKVIFNVTKIANHLKKFYQSFWKTTGAHDRSGNYYSVFPATSCAYLIYILSVW